MNEGGLKARIDKEHVIVVHLRPEPGEPAPDPVVIGSVLDPTVSMDDSADAVKVGASGELIFTKKAYTTLGCSQYPPFPYDKLVRVFAPRAWLYYEYSERKQP